MAQSRVVQDEVVDELQLIEECAAGIDLDALHQEELAEDTVKTVDVYGEPEDYSNEYITVSHQSSTEPPALCLNTEEIFKVFDEIMGYLIFQRKDILDDFLSLSLSEMKVRMGERRTPFTRRQFFCPAFIAEDTSLPRAPRKEEYFDWATGDGRVAYQKERELWMWNHWYKQGESSLLLCDNLEHCCEAIRTHSLIWQLYLWDYTTMNVNEFLTPFIAVNSEGVRAIRPNAGEGPWGLLSSRLRLLCSNALGIKKFRYVAFKNMPPEVEKDGVYDICIEGPLEAQQNRDRLNPEALFICQHMGAQFNKEYQAGCMKVLVTTINGRITNKKNREHVEEWQKKARTTLLQAGLQTLKDQVRSGNCYDPTFEPSTSPFDVMD